MKCGARVALGVAGGYFLGRTKKMKLALMLGGMAAGRQAGGPGELLGQGTKLLRQSPELAALTDQMRGRLLEAGKGAAMAVAARQVESLTDRVGKRVESLGTVGTGRAEKAPEQPDPEDVDETGDEVPDDEAAATDEELEAQRGTNGADEEADPPRRHATRRRAGASSSKTSTKNSSAESSSSPTPTKRSADSRSSGSRRATGTAGAGNATRSAARTATGTAGSTGKGRRPARTRRSSTDD